MFVLFDNSSAQETHGSADVPLEFSAPVLSATRGSNRPFLHPAQANLHSETSCYWSIALLKQVSLRQRIVY